jgi:hypothetical protein
MYELDGEVRHQYINDRPRSQIRDIAPGEGGDDVKHITPSGNGSKKRNQMFRKRLKKDVSQKFPAHAHGYLFIHTFFETKPERRAIYAM